MTFNPRHSQEITNDGLTIEDGVWITSGPLTPMAAGISPIGPSRYYQTNGNVYYHTGSGSWVLESNGGGTSNFQIDGGTPSSVYGGTTPIDGGGV